jgi:hypothetical protein
MIIDLISSILTIALLTLQPEFSLVLLQWMTAGRGIVHSEMPASDGVQKGLQLWINLASKDKMYEPYQADHQYSC